MLRLPSLAAALLACLTLFVCGAVAAHTHLKSSLPAAGATLAEAPTEIRLHFQGPVEASLSRVSLETNTGEPVAAAAAATDPGDKGLLVVKLAQPPASGGLYRHLARDCSRHAQNERQLQLPGPALEMAARGAPLAAARLFSS